MSGIALGARSPRRLRFLVWIFARNPSTLLGLFLVAAFLVLAAFGWLIVPDPRDATGAMHLASKLLPPSAMHWFGTDEMGDDLFTRVVMGTRTSLWVGLTITAIAALIGAPLGVAAGLFRRAGTGGHHADHRRLPVRARPGAGARHRRRLGPRHPARGGGARDRLVARLRAPDRGQGAHPARASRSSRRRGRWAPRDARILATHILPNCVSPLVIKASMDMGLAILAAASLGFIGLGARPPAPEWGAMISTARSYMPEYWWYSFFPGLFIFLTVLGFNLFGDGLRDILDPRSARG